MSVAGIDPIAAAKGLAIAEVLAAQIGTNPWVLPAASQRGALAVGSSSNGWMVAGGTLFSLSCATKRY
jgi:hypothetical protein